MTSESLFAEIQNRLPIKVGSYRRTFIKGHKYSNPIMSNEDIYNKLALLSPEQLQKVHYKINILKATKLKSPALVFWVYNFLLGGLGVARFAIGDKAWGIFRIALTCVSIGFGLYTDLFYSETMALVSQLLDWVNVAAWILDLMIVGVFLRNQNLEKVNQAIEEVKNDSN